MNELSFTTAQQSLSLISLLLNRVGCAWKAELAEPWSKAAAKGEGQQDQYAERSPGQL